MDTNRRKKVLVIDDDKDFGLSLTYFFERHPFQLLLAHSLAEGMGILEKEHPDFVFLDQGLPDGMGWDQAEFIEAHHPQVRLILMSTLPIPGSWLAKHRILRKPVSLDDVLACLR